jgi:hypothetical protein
MHQFIGYLLGDVRLPGQLAGRQLIDYFWQAQDRGSALLHAIRSPAPVEYYPPSDRERTDRSLFIEVLEGRLSETSGQPERMESCAC